MLSGALALCGQTAVVAQEPPPITDPVAIHGEEPRERDDVSEGEVHRPEDLPSARSVADLLRDAPGVAIRDSGGSGVTVSLRGTDARHVLIVLDDVPLNMALGGVDLRQLELESIGRIDLHRGGSALFGAHAVGGALAVRSRDTPRGSWTHAGTSVDSLGEVATRTGFGLGSDAGGVLASLTLRHGEGDFSFEDANGADRVRENNDRTALHFSGRSMTRLGASSRLTLTAHHHLELRGSPGVEQFPTRSARVEDQSNVAVVQWESRGFLDGVDMRASAWHQFRENVHRDPSPQLPPEIDNQHFDQRVGGHLETEWRWADWSWLRLRLESAHEWAEIVRSEERTHPTRTRFGAVLSDEMWFADDVVQLLGGVRADWSDDTGWAWVPKAGVVIRPHRSVALRVNGSRAYRPPSFEELFYDAGHVRGNPDLGPEDAWSVDASVAWAGDVLGAKVGVFHLAIENLIVFLPKTAFVFEADNTKSAISQGLESAIWWRPLGGTEFSGQWTWIDARFLDTELALPARSPHRVSARLRQHLFGWDVFTRVVWQDAFFLDRFEQLSEESRWTWDAGARARPFHWVALGVLARNLLDKRDATDSLQQPLPGFSVQVTLDFHLEEGGDGSD